MKNIFFNIAYHKVDSSLPDLIVYKGNNILLYSRVDAIIPSSLDLVEIKEKPKIIVPGQFEAQPGNYKVGYIKPYYSIPLNIVIEEQNKTQCLLFADPAITTVGLTITNQGVLIGNNQEIYVNIVNHSPLPVKIEKGLRIAYLNVGVKPVAILKYAGVWKGSNGKVVDISKNINEERG